LYYTYIFDYEKLFLPKIIARAHTHTQARILSVWGGRRAGVYI